MIGRFLLLLIVVFSNIRGSFGIIFTPNISFRNVLYEAIREAGCSNSLMAHYIIDEAQSMSTVTTETVSKLTGYSLATVRKCVTAAQQLLALNLQQSQSNNLRGTQAKLAALLQDNSLATSPYDSYLKRGGPTGARAQAHVPWVVKKG